ncbi:hypothetical protein GCM10010174_04910 [Kutzneria viridogrisea]|uniref:Uncharacterized protein n=2 Tax=Kutzneria TaxID=43356 RepID=W5WGJ4_9PSEU|nr:hypothetical protein [Kutzneria albida]AHH99982.1 hypothetical protein KALB_6623 [Kutzneria albida DSM 43870]MBA8925162.1 hypothetical protein [Kutzneria viridogrisea]
MGLPVGRDPAGRARAELFLISAVVTVLVTRGYLAATGYPKIGGDSGLHVAHVLFGGILMLVAMLLVLLTFGSAAERLASLLGGIGFGLFIDELGKFLTSDNNYFFQPAIALMYVIFVIAFLAVRLAPPPRQPQPEVCLGYAYTALADASLGRLDTVHRRHALELLAGCEQDSEVTAVVELLSRERAVPEGRVTRAGRWLLRTTQRLLLTRVAQWLVIAVFVLQAIALIADVVVSVVEQDPGVSTSSNFVDWATALTGLAVGALSVAGVVQLIGRKRLAALRTFHLAMLVSLLIGQVFLFAESQFNALPDLVFNLLVLAALRLTLSAYEARAAAGS